MQWNLSMWTPLGPEKVSVLIDIFLFQWLHLEVGYCILECPYRGPLL